MDNNTTAKEGIVYLAAPYTHPSSEVRKARFESVTRMAAKLVADGRVVYSPLTMTHPIDLVLVEEGETLGSKFWVDFDEAFMSICSEMIVLKLSGWERSSGVKREVEFFSARKLPIVYVDPDGSAILDVTI